MQHHIRIQPKTMATSYYFQTQKSFSILLPISLTFFLLLLTKANSTESLSFSFNKFVPNQPNLILHGKALVTSTGKLQLTKVDNGIPISYSLGRALYSSPLHIWDNTTGNVASFVTTFSFIINAPEKAFSADGLAFFLAPLDTLPKTPEGGGGLLGLFPDGKKDKSRKIVAVEFDTFSNDKWDPQGRHIGIDVNSIKSIKTASWGLANGQLATVIISYQASTKMLTASLVHPSRQTSYVVSSVVDLKKVLPEFVSVGFSATTGLSEEYVETHDVLSWSFDSKLPDCSGDALETNVHLSSHAIRDSM